MLSKILLEKGVGAIKQYWQGKHADVSSHSLE